MRSSGPAIPGSACLRISTCCWCFALRLQDAAHDRVLCLLAIASAGVCLLLPPEPRAGRAAANPRYDPAAEPERRRWILSGPGTTITAVPCRPFDTSFGADGLSGYEACRMRGENEDLSEGRHLCLVTDDPERAKSDLLAIFGVNLACVDPEVEVFGIENPLYRFGLPLVEIAMPPFRSPNGPPGSEAVFPRVWKACPATWKTRFSSFPRRYPTM